VSKNEKRKEKKKRRTMTVGLFSGCFSFERFFVLVACPLSLEASASSLALSLERLLVFISYAMPHVAVVRVNNFSTKITRAKSGQEQTRMISPSLSFSFHHLSPHPSSRQSISPSP
jgi:hypothetical protein